MWAILIFINRDDSGRLQAPIDLIQK
jgi:hypothetical protein